MRELTFFLEETSRQRPVVIFLDDLHWADVGTVDVLSHLAPRLVRMRTLVVIAYRLHELALTRHSFARLRNELLARGQLREVQVCLLALDDVREYVQSAFGSADVPVELPAFVFRKTEGNPLFMTDLVRYVREAHIPVTSNLLTSDVPDSLRGLIERMLQAFDPALRQLLAIAAVQGYEFDSATLARVSGRAAADVEDLLRSAEHVHAFVAVIDERELPDATVSLTYRFVHVLYQEALYASITPSRRIAWATQIAEALVVSHTGRTDAIAGQLAMLFETGREFWQAAQYFLITSRNAARLFAFAAATELADRGLQCLRSVHGVDDLEMSRRELELTFAKAVPLASLHGYGNSDVEELAHRMVRLGEKVGDPAATSAGLAATWIVRMVRGDCRAAKEAGARLTVLAAETGNDILLINGHMQTQLACHHLGEFREAACHADAVLKPRAVRTAPGALHQRPRSGGRVARRIRAEFIDHRASVGIVGGVRPRCRPRFRVAPPRLARVRVAVSRLGTWLPQRLGHRASIGRFRHRDRKPGRLGADTRLEPVRARLGAGASGTNRGGALGACGRDRGEPVDHGTNRAAAVQRDDGRGAAAATRCRGS